MPMTSEVPGGYNARRSLSGWTVPYPGFISCHKSRSQRQQASVLEDTLGNVQGS